MQIFDTAMTTKKNKNEYKINKLFDTKLVWDFIGFLLHYCRNLHTDCGVKQPHNAIHGEVLLVQLAIGQSIQVLVSTAPIIQNGYFALEPFQLIYTLLSIHNDRVHAGKTMKIMIKRNDNQYRCFLINYIARFDWSAMVVFVKWKIEKKNIILPCKRPRVIFLVLDE